MTPDTHASTAKRNLERRVGSFLPPEYLSTPFSQAECTVLQSTMCRIARQDKAYKSPRYDTKDRARQCGGSLNPIYRVAIPNMHDLKNQHTGLEDPDNQAWKLLRCNPSAHLAHLLLAHKDDPRLGWVFDRLVLLVLLLDEPDKAILARGLRENGDHLDAGLLPALEPLLLEKDGNTFSMDAHS
jgi:hypothetical protein